MLSGLHAPNRATSPNTLEIVQAGGFKAIKLLAITGCEHTLAEARTVKAAGADTLMLRLPDVREPDGHYANFRDYASQCIALINEWQGGVGCKWFQLGNEPNWLWTTPQYGPYPFVWWLRQAIGIIRKNVPHDTRLICPPLSFSPALWHHGPPNPTSHTLDEWLEAYSFTSAGTLPDIMHLCDAIGVNSYWQSAGQMDDPSYGTSYFVMSARAGGMPAVVCEWGSSVHELKARDGTPLYTAAQVEALRIAQYPRWIETARGSGTVESAYVYIGPVSTPDWAGFQVSRALANAMKAS